MSNPITAYVVGGCRATTNFLNESSAIYAVNGPDDPHPDLDLYDIIVFTGGADVHPKYYGEKPLPGSYYNLDRDIQELSIFHKTKDTHYHFGICRGLQLLAVVNQCFLWQDISGHNMIGNHEMKTTTRGTIKGVTSVHHQAVKLDNRSRPYVLAYEEFDQSVEATSPSLPEPIRIKKVVEAAYFPDTRSFGVQGHPEYHGASEEFKDYVLYHLIEDKKTGYLANK